MHEGLFGDKMAAGQWAVVARPHCHLTRHENKQSRIHAKHYSIYGPGLQPNQACRQLYKGLLYKISGCGNPKLAHAKISDLPDHRDKKYVQVVQYGLQPGGSSTQHKFDRGMRLRGQGGGGG